MAWARRVYRRLGTTGTTFAIIALVIVAATTATLLDEDISEENIVQAGAFELYVNGKNDPDRIVCIENILPGERMETTVTLELKGTGKADVDVVFRKIETTQGIQTDPETVAETVLGGPIFDLEKQLYVSIGKGSRSTMKEGLSKGIGVLNAGETTVVPIVIELKSTTGNEYQGDRCIFEMAFLAKQY